MKDWFMKLDKRTRLFIGGAVIVSVLLLIAEAAKAQQLYCAPRAEIVPAITGERYGESRQSLGLIGDDRMMEVYASTETGTWTVLVTDARGTACILVSGGVWQRDGIKPAEGDDM